MSVTVSDGDTGDLDAPQPDTALQPDDAPRSSGNLMEAPVAPSLSGRDIDEDVIPPENKPVARRVAEANIQLRRWIVAGIGGLMTLILLITSILVLARPELTDFARSFLQVALTGMFGLGGSVVGFLFAREKDH